MKRLVLPGAKRCKGAHPSLVDLPKNLINTLLQQGVWRLAKGLVGWLR
jgi:hypothetical protein